MTYCVAIKTNEGIVFASDSRTNAGVDHIRSYSKMHTFELKHRCFVLLNAGNLATCQAVVNAIKSDLEHHNAKNLQTIDYLFDAAQYIGELNVNAQRLPGQKDEKNVNLEASFIIGGQIQDQEPEIYLVYPQGNYISASEENPYLQIGEIKYGKPILDRIITPKTPIDDAARCALVSLDSTMRSNVSVGPPLELAIYRRADLKLAHLLKLTQDEEFYIRLTECWKNGLLAVFDQLPRFEWEQSG